MSETTVTKCDDCGEQIDTQSEVYVLVTAAYANAPFPSAAKALHYHDGHVPKALSEIAPTKMQVTTSIEPAA